MKYPELKIAYSTCPNDTFIFDALVNKRIESEGIGLDVWLADIEELNQAVIRNEPDISKISFAVYPEISDRYQILNSGSALGFGNGPLLISKHKIYPDEIDDISIAIPGFNTTANYLLSILYPKSINRTEYLFSEIEEVVLSGEKDAGLIIHETRFTYQNRGLMLVVDLGARWEEEYQLPIPLGGIVVRREFPYELKIKIQELIGLSIRFGMVNPSMSNDYIKNYAQDLSDEVIRKHIELYVNDFSVDLSVEGRKALSKIFELGEQNGLFKMKHTEIFV